MVTWPTKSAADSYGQTGECSTTTRVACMTCYMDIYYISLYQIELTEQSHHRKLYDMTSRCHCSFAKSKDNSSAKI